MVVTRANEDDTTQDSLSTVITRARQQLRRWTGSATAAGCGHCREGDGDLASVRAPVGVQVLCLRVRPGCSTSLRDRGRARSEPARRRRPRSWLPGWSPPPSPLADGHTVISPKEAKVATTRNTGITGITGEGNRLSSAGFLARSSPTRCARAQNHRTRADQPAAVRLRLGSEVGSRSERAKTRLEERTAWRTLRFVTRGPRRLAAVSG